jgi:plastocyanin
MTTRRTDLASISVRGTLAALLLALTLALGACGSDPENGGESASDAASSSSGGDYGSAGGRSYGSGSSEESEEGSGSVRVAGRDANDHGSKDVSGIGEVELEMDDLYFEPTVLRGETGQELTIVLHNEGDAAHNFSIGSLDIDQDVAPGQQAEVGVAFPRSGTLLFFCRFHSSSGMNGALAAP